MFTFLLPPHPKSRWHLGIIIYILLHTLAQGSAALLYTSKTFVGMQEIFMDVITAYSCALHMYLCVCVTLCQSMSRSVLGV